MVGIVQRKCMLTTLSTNHLYIASHRNLVVKSQNMFNHPLPSRHEWQQLPYIVDTQCNDRWSECCPRKLFSFIALDNTTSIRLGYGKPSKVPNIQLDEKHHVAIAKRMLLVTGLHTSITTCNRRPRSAWSWVLEMFSKEMDATCHS